MVSHIHQKEHAVPRILAASQKPLFVEQFNRSCFMFDHSLHQSDLFELENLAELSKRLPDSFYSTTDDSISDGWRSSSTQPRSLHETIATIGESNSLVLLKGLAGDPEFGPLFRDILAELEDTVGETLRADIAEARATLVLSSPRRVTPYHIDAEVNFLLQLRGEKIVNIFDATDRTLLTDLELEAFFTGDINAAKYKKERQRDARVFDFVPGTGLHLPILAPHWTLNGESVSVAISINCSLHSNARTAKIYKLNGKLRSRGLAPLSPGISTWQDRVKLAVVDGFELSRSVGRRERTKLVERS
jgi:hypothetical protein